MGGGVSSKFDGGGVGVGLESIQWGGVVGMQGEGKERENILLISVLLISVLSYFSVKLRLSLLK